MDFDTGVSLNAGLVSCLHPNLPLLPEIPFEGFDFHKTESKMSNDGLTVHQTSKLLVTPKRKLSPIHSPIRDILNTNLSILSKKTPIFNFVDPVYEDLWSGKCGTDNLPTDEDRAGIIYECSSCGLKGNMTTMFLHAKNEHAVDVCLYCLKYFKYARELMVHLYRVHRVQSQSYSSWTEFLECGGDKTFILCIDCNKTFPSEALNCHLQECCASSCSNYVQRKVHTLKDLCSLKKASNFNEKSSTKDDSPSPGKGFIGFDLQRKNRRNDSVAHPPPPKLFRAEILSSGPRVPLNTKKVMPKLHSALCSEMSSNSWNNNINKGFSKTSDSEILRCLLSAVSANPNISKDLPKPVETVVLTHRPKQQLVKVLGKRKIPSLTNFTNILSKQSPKDDINNSIPNSIRSRKPKAPPKLIKVASSSIKNKTNVENPCDDNSLADKIEKPQKKGVIGTFSRKPNEKSLRGQKLSAVMDTNNPFHQQLQPISRDSAKSSSSTQNTVSFIPKKIHVITRNDSETAICKPQVVSQKSIDSGISYSNIGAGGEQRKLVPNIDNINDRNNIVDTKKPSKRFVGNKVSRNRPTVSKNKESCVPLSTTVTYTENSYLATDFVKDNEINEKFEVKETPVIQVDPLLIVQDTFSRIGILISELCEKLVLQNVKSEVNEGNNIYELSINCDMQEISDTAILSKMVSKAAEKCIQCRQIKLIRVDKRQLVMHLLSNHSWEFNCSKIPTILSLCESSDEVQIKSVIEDCISAVEKNLTIECKEDIKILYSACADALPNDVKSEIIPLEWKDFTLAVLEKVFRSEDIIFAYTGDNCSVKVDEEKPCECLLCAVTVHSQQDLFAHWRKYHTGVAMKCAMCPTKFLFVGAFFSHLCSGCEMESKYSTVQEAGFHDANFLKYQCNICNDMKLSTFFNYMVHIRKDHNTCELCLQTLASQTGLEHHLRKHKLNYFCWKCETNYLSKKNLMNHLFWKHGTESEDCSKCLKKKWLFVYHFCIPPAMFVCDVCHFSFTKPKSLIVHKRVHSGQQLKHCPHKSCFQKFISKKLLEKHIQQIHIKTPEMEIPELQRNTPCSNNEEIKDLSKEQGGVHQVDNILDSGLEDREIKDTEAVQDANKTCRRVEHPEENVDAVFTETVKLNSNLHEPISRINTGESLDAVTNNEEKEMNGTEDGDPSALIMEKSNEEGNTTFPSLGEIQCLPKIAGQSENQNVEVSFKTLARKQCVPKQLFDIDKIKGPNLSEDSDSCDSGDDDISKILDGSSMSPKSPKITFQDSIACENGSAVKIDDFIFDNAVPEELKTAPLLMVTLLDHPQEFQKSESGPNTSKIPLPPFLECKTFITMQTSIYDENALPQHIAYENAVLSLTNEHDYCTLVSEKSRAPLLTQQINCHLNKVGHSTSSNLSPTQKKPNTLRNSREKPVGKRRRISSVVSSQSSCNSSCTSDDSMSISSSSSSSDSDSELTVPKLSILNNLDASKPKDKDRKTVQEKSTYVVEFVKKPMKQILRKPPKVKAKPTPKKKMILENKNKIKKSKPRPKNKKRKFVGKQKPAHKAKSIEGYIPESDLETEDSGSDENFHKRQLVEIIKKDAALVNDNWNVSNEKFLLQVVRGVKDYEELEVLTKPSPTTKLPKRDKKPKITYTVMQSDDVKPSRLKVRNVPIKPLILKLHFETEEVRTNLQHKHPPLLNAQSDKAVYRKITQKAAASSTVIGRKSSPNSPNPKNVTKFPGFPVLKTSQIANSVPLNSKLTGSDFQATEGSVKKYYCICQKVHDSSNSNMIGCDGADCRYEWFHFECVGISSPPEGKWFCTECNGKRLITGN